MKEKCCGNCKYFKNEDAGGWGTCEFHLSAKCDDKCGYHSFINNGWTEITPDNVEEIRKNKRKIVIMNPKEWDAPEMLYTIPADNLVLYSEWGGYYYYVLPELKIDNEQAD